MSEWEPGLEIVFPWGGRQAERSWRKSAISLLGAAYLSMEKSFAKKWRKQSPERTS